MDADTTSFFSTARNSGERPCTSFLSMSAPHSTSARHILCVYVYVCVRASVPTHSSRLLDLSCLLCRSVCLSACLSVCLSCLYGVLFPRCFHATSAAAAVLCVRRLAVRTVRPRSSCHWRLAAPSCRPHVNHATSRRRNLVAWVPKSAATTSCVSALSH